MHLNNRNNVCDASLPRPEAFFYGKSPGDERSGSRGNVATFMLGSSWVSRAVSHVPRAFPIFYGKSPGDEVVVQSR